MTSKWQQALPISRSFFMYNHAVMSMVESGLGISILPSLILTRIPYKIVAKPLNVPVYRDIGIALKSSKTASLTVKRFMEYLQYR